MTRLPPPIPPAASTATPRTEAARARGRQLGAVLRRNLELVLAILGAAGISVAQAADGLAAVIRWARGAGMWPALALLALGVGATGIRQLLAVIRGLSQRLDVLTSQWQQQHDELRGEVHALRGEIELRMGGEAAPSAVTLRDMEEVPRA